MLLCISPTTKFYNIQKHLCHKEQYRRKSKIRRTCESNLQIKASYRYKETVKNMNNNENIILKQDKRHGIVLLSCMIYIEKCCKMLDIDQFRKLKEDPLKSIGIKVQQILRKLNMFSLKENTKIVSSWFRTWCFLWTN